MKKLLFLAMSVVLLPSLAMAAWTINVSVADVKGHYVIYKIECISDGDALSATDFVALMSDEDRRYVATGATMMVLNIDPGTGGAAPITTINVTLTDITGMEIFDEEGFSNTEDTVGVPLFWDLWQYPVMTSKMYLTLNDIGNSGDTVTFYIMCWID